MAPAGALTSRGAHPSPLLSRLPSLLLAPQVLVRAGVDLDDLARADEEGDLLEGGEGGRNRVNAPRPPRARAPPRSTPLSRTMTTAPVSSTAGLVPPDTVLPLTPGSVSAIASSTVFGGSTEMTFPFHVTSWTSAPSFMYLAQASSFLTRVSS
jgi:hypothetical protein